MGLIVAMLIPILISLAICVFYIICVWKILAKAGQPGWSQFIPIYNIIVMLEVVGKPWWYMFLFIIPIWGWFILPIQLIHKLSKSFGQGVGFTCGLIFLAFIFYPILALGNYQYTKPQAVPAAV